jgi:myo-inositol-1(or 4)-monophosphatase
MLDVAIEAATQAGKFLKYSLGKVKTVETKEGEVRNLVSDIDKASEKKIIEIIRRRFPSHAILAEEGGRTSGDSEYTWVIDPLDGTTNYLHGVPIYCVTIGLEKKGEIIAGAVYDPNHDELFTAEKGAGAFVNGKRLRVSEADSLIGSLLVTGFPYDIASRPGNAVNHFVHFLMEAQGVRRLGSAALDLAYVAAGRLDGFWEVSLHPWDMAAGVLLVAEAGGNVTDYAGKPVNIHGRTVVATNGRIHSAMLEIIRNGNTA